MAGVVWWTPERLERLATLAAEGLTAAEIARRLATRTHRPTDKAVRCAAERHDIRLWHCRGDARRRRGLASRTRKRKEATK